MKYIFKLYSDLQRSSAGIHCEFDTEADLARALRDSNLPKKRWNWIQRHHGSFTGKQLKNWLESEGQNGQEAAERLMTSNFIRSVQEEVTDFRPDGTLYQMIDQTSIAALNAGNLAECKPLPPRLGLQLINFERWYFIMDFLIMHTKCNKVLTS